jgi:hypothetical protein
MHELSYVTWSHPQTGSMTVGQTILGLIKLESMHCAYNEGAEKESSPISSSVFKVFIKSSFLFLLVTRYLSYLGGG